MLLVVALPSLARGERLPLKYYTVADGLAHNVINKIVRDSRGFLWFCTEEGLSRFDGYTFTTFGTEQGLPHASVNDILETRDGNYWVATNGGLVRFNPRGVPDRAVVVANDAVGVSRSPMFSVVQTESGDRLARVITTLREGRDGTIWCGTYKGLFRLAQEGREASLRAVDIGLAGDANQSFVSSLLEDRFGTLWVGTYNGLCRRWADGSFARYNAKDGLSETIHALLEDRRGQLWVGTRDLGLYRLNIRMDHGPPEVLRRYSHLDGLGTDWVFDLAESADGKLWVGTNHGFCELSLNELGEIARLRSYTKSNGLSYHEIASLTEDRDGNLWLGTNNNGAMKLARPGFTTFDERDGLSQVTSLFESNTGELYAYGYVLGDQRASVFEGAKLDLLNPETSSYRRLGRFDGQHFDWFIPRVLKNEVSSWSDRPLVLQARSGEWWIGLASGLFEFSHSNSAADLKTARRIATYSSKTDFGAEVYCIYEDSRGDLWVSTVATTGNGLFRWERATRTLHNMGNTSGLPPLKDRLPAAFQEDRAGNVWIGFAQGELVRYRGDHFEVFTAADGLTGGRVNALYLDRAGHLWVAAARGVSRIDDPSADRLVFTTYSAAQGLSGNIAFAITEDFYGHIYIGTAQGLDRLDTKTGHLKHYTTADGLAGGKIYVVFRDREGWLWIGTTEGLSRFLPEAERQSPAPLVLLTGLRVAGAAQNVSALGETEMHVPDLAASSNQLQIDFVGLGFAPGESLRYQYMLVGGDHDWSVPTAQRTVTYARLAPGRYRFLVRAVNADGEVSFAPAAIIFQVLPPLWLRWWFIALVVIAVGGAGYTVYRYRVARLLQVANVRTRIATDLHDDIGANLTKIAILSEVIKQQHGNGNADDEDDSPLSSIARISRESVPAMSDIVWAINPERDHLIDLVRRMRRHAEELFTARGIGLTFSAPGAEQNLRLSVDVRRDLFLIFKEAINNTARHARATHVDIELRATSSALTLLIADDGVGFDPKSETEGQGLISMPRRAQNLGGSISVESQPAKGTTIRLTLPTVRARSWA